MTKAEQTNNKNTRRGGRRRRRSQLQRETGCSREATPRDTLRESDKGGRRRKRCPRKSDKMGTRKETQWAKTASDDGTRRPT